ncbi:MAG: ROK family protein [Solirubrobacteraceae bacterium]
MAAEPDHVVAIDVGGTTLKGSLVDRSGCSHGLVRRQTPVAEGAQAVLEAVTSLAADLSRADRGARPVAVGLAVPGLVQERTGSVLNATNLGWRDVAIGPLLTERLEMTVAVSHDVRAGALAEGVLGAARGCRDYLLVTLGTGVGAAVVIDGRPYTGAHGIGGELGHVAVEPRGPICGCGRAGCLEAVASAGHIALRYHAMMGGAGEPVSAEEVARRAVGRGDAIANSVWREAIQALTLTIANYATLLDPELVVIGGGMAGAGANLFDPVRHGLNAHMRFGEPPPVVPASLGAEAVRFGAAVAAWRAAGIDESELASWKR